MREATIDAEMCNIRNRLRAEHTEQLDKWWSSSMGELWLQDEVIMRGEQIILPEKLRKRAIGTLGRSSRHRSDETKNQSGLLVAGHEAINRGGGKGVLLMCKQRQNGYLKNSTNRNNTVADGAVDETGGRH